MFNHRFEMPRVPCWLFCLAACVVAPTARGQTASPCDAPAYHLLDFWIGDWEVTAGGKIDGHDRVTRQLSGCAVHEEWSDAGGGHGFSLFYYQPSVDKWRQVWVTDHANQPGGLKEKELILRLDDGGVRFQGTIMLPQGKAVLDRTTLTPLAGGDVHQVIELSRDQGATWQAVYDARYRRATP